jgi:hypothetical protein
LVSAVAANDKLLTSVDAHLEPCPGPFAGLIRNWGKYSVWIGDFLVQMNLPHTSPFNRTYAEDFESLVNQKLRPALLRFAHLRVVSAAINHVGDSLLAVHNWCVQ